MPLTSWFLLLRNILTKKKIEKEKILLNFHWNGHKGIAFNYMSENPLGIFLLSICLRILSCTLANKETHFTGPNQIRQAWWSIAFLKGFTGEKTTKRWAVMGTHVAIKQCEASRSLTWTLLPVVEPLRELCNCPNCKYVYTVNCQIIYRNMKENHSWGRCMSVYVCYCVSINAHACMCLTTLPFYPLWPRVNTV